MNLFRDSENTKVVTVLRDVVMNAQPHALTRPAQLSAAKSQDPRTQQGPGRSQGSQPRLSYEDGLAEGLRLGRAEGLAQAKTAQEDVVRVAIEEARRAAHDHGLQQGLQEGLERSAAAAEQQALRLREAAEVAHEQGLQAIHERCARLDALLVACAAEIARALEKSEDDLVAIAHEALCKVLGSEAVRPEVITAMVKQLVAQHGLRAALSVHLHPADLEALGQGDRTPLHSDWQLVADPSISLGGVILRSANGSLDARLETQLHVLGETLLSVRRDRQMQSVPAASGGR